MDQQRTITSAQQPSPSSSRPRVVILGAGNVATHLSQALAGVANVCQVWSRSQASAERLAALLPDAQPVSSFDNIVRDADFYIISVPDDAVASVSAALGSVNGIVAHTSGSVPVTAIAQKGGGVFYPLQTFSRTTPVCVEQVPFFIEGTTAAACMALKSLAASISESVHEADSAHRAVLHLAAVFACNFANHMWAIAQDQLQRGGYDLDVFGPLLHETLRKALANGAFASQTGPAVRGDNAVMQAHEAKLSGDEARLYRLISSMIVDSHHSKTKANEQD